MKRLAALVGLLAALVAPVFAEPVYVSTATTSVDATKTIRTGRWEIYKIVVSSPGSANATLAVTDGGTKIIDIDASAARDITYQVQGSSNIIYTTAGDTPAKVQILWAPRFVSDPGYQIKHSTGTYTLRSLFTGRAFLKRVIVSKPADMTGITVYDSNGVVSRPIADIAGALFSNTEYNVQISSGLTYTTTGDVGVSFLFKRY